MRSAVACAVVICVSAATAVAQEPVPQPTFRSGVNFVRIDVIATDGRARPITDLSEADFEILEDGKPQVIEQFRLVTVGGSLPEGRSSSRAIRSIDDEELEASREDTRVFVIFLDDYHVTKRNSMRIRDTLMRFVTDQLGPNDLIAIMYPLTTVSAFGFTRNHDSIVAALQRFEGRKCDSEPCDYTPRHPPEENYAHYPRLQIEAIRNEVVASALEGLAVRLGSLREARKSVLYVSEGFSGGFALTSANQDLRDMIVAANRNNVAIYAFDPRGLTIGRMGASQSVLRGIAEDTGGRAIVNRNTLGEGLADMVRDASSYYMIGYSSSVAVNDGRFHEVEVRVKRRGVDLRSRKGYWALSESDALRAAAPPSPGLPPAIAGALADLSRATSPAAYGRTWFGTERGADDRTRVTVVWEPLSARAESATSPGGRGERRARPGRVTLRVTDSSGALVFQGGHSPGDAAAVGSGGSGTRPAGTFRPHQFVFEAPSGDHEVRVTVEADVGGERLDTEIRTIDVPEYSGTGVAISTPRVFRARTAAEMRTITSDRGSPPTGGREFSRAERLLIRFHVYGTAEDEQPATAALLNRAGQKMADLPVTPAPAGGTHQIDLGLGSIPAGDYLVEIALPETADGTRQLIAIRVAG